MKSVFPTVEEYLLLDVLSNSDNNVQKAADKLVKMGYVKRDTPSKKILKSLKYQNKGKYYKKSGVVYNLIIDYLNSGAPRLHARKKEEERLAEKRTPLPKPPPLKSEKEKQELRRKMCNK